MRLYLFTVLMLSFAALSVFAQVPDEPKKEIPKPETPKKADQPKAELPNEFDVTFSDAGKLKAVVLDTSIEVKTKYGKLTIPTGEIRRIELGFRYPDGVEAKIAAAIEKLGAPVFQQREDAEDELMMLKNYALAQLKRATKRENEEELSRRASDLVKRINKTIPVEQQNPKDFDLVETAEVTVRGQLTSAVLKVRTKQFGETSLKLEEVQSLRAASAALLGGELQLDAAKYARLNWSAWLDTKIDVTEGSPLTITASGQIDIWPQEPGRYMCSPQGNGATAPNPPAGMFPQNLNPGGPGFRGFVQAGSVMGKIGEKGTPFVIGASYKKDKVATAGRLYLQIAPSNWNNDNCSGNYTIKISQGE